MEKAQFGVNRAENAYSKNAGKNEYFLHIIRENVHQHLPWHHMSPTEK
jgi:hypothetical protein